MRRMIPSGLAVSLAVVGCGGSGSHGLSRAQAEARIRSLELRECHLRVRQVHCIDKGSTWFCVFGAGQGGMYVGGGLQLQKQARANDVTTIAC